jgi:hypothetical protein
MGWLLLSFGAVTNIANESTTNPSAAKATHSTARDLKITLSIEILASGIRICFDFENLDHF